MPTYNFIIPDKKRTYNGSGRKAWLGHSCPCKCGWVADQRDEADHYRLCEKCGSVFERKIYGWCQVNDMVWTGECFRKKGIGKALKLR